VKELKLIPGGARRVPVVVAGVVLAGIPTLFTVIPELAAERSLSFRRWTLAGWIVVLVATVFVSMRRDRQLDKVTAGAAAAQSKARQYAFLDVVSALCARAPGFGDGYEFTVYLADADGQQLRPIWPDRPSPTADPRIFEAGKGATGHAYSKRKIFWVLGDDVSNDAYELAPDQQSFFGDFRTVAAAPIFDLIGEQPIGAVTALHADEQTAFFEPGADGQKALLNLADTLSVVIGRLIEPGDLQ
jgi:hypothetical protein